ncbi:hypothetical protein ACET97_01890 [Aeromonas enteropelogenes]|uniref:hypothetical protein n=1 Tax=Aeromonas enteropelogenes TaxID=29489 RepID=UPI0038D053C1
MELRVFLIDVDSGKKSFSATSDADLPSFQRLVRTAKEAHAFGYTTKYKTQTNNETPERYIQSVLVGEITDLGRQFLLTLAEPSLLPTQVPLE